MSPTYNNGRGALAGAAAADERYRDRRHPSHTRVPRSLQEHAVATAAGFGGSPPLPRSIVAGDWRPLDPPRNTLHGFCSLRLPSGLVLRECSYHVMQDDEHRWVGLPSRPQLDAEGRHRIDPGTGKRLYALIVEIPSAAARARFQSAALAAIDRLLGCENRRP